MIFALNYPAAQAWLHKVEAPMLKTADASETHQSDAFEEETSLLLGKHGRNASRAGRNRRRKSTKEEPHTKRSISGSDRAVLVFLVQEYWNGKTRTRRSTTAGHGNLVHDGVSTHQEAVQYSTSVLFHVTSSHTLR